MSLLCTPEYKREINKWEINPSICKSRASMFGVWVDCSANGTMHLCHDPVVPLVLGHQAPHSSCLDSRGWISQLDSGGCASRVDSIECITFGQHMLHVVCRQWMGFVCIAFGWHGNVHRIRMVDGGRILFRQHGCTSQLDAMGCVERSGVGNVPIASLTWMSMAWCAGNWVMCWRKWGHWGPEYQGGMPLCCGLVYLLH
jgi:hypothetical protein